jgi:hypothetical protein
LGVGSWNLGVDAAFSAGRKARFYFGVLKLEEVSTVNFL